MKKVIGIIGSLRAESINRIVFNEYKALVKGKFELDEGEIKDFPLYNEDIDGAPEAVKNLSKKILNSDGVIFFSPEYNYSIPGLLKNALDWISREESKPFNEKPAAIIGASPGNIGTARMQYHLRQVAVFLNINVLNKPEVMIGQSFEKVKDGKLVDEKTKEFLIKHADSFLKHMK